ncbi:hypothetical protein V6N13_016703 [Hibiscus sabdariffa]|uniref:Uncharacterized protein n=2 Tax=Hibiscus sabdariffa TaxID=183260 RepID=A0ABR2PUB8_9ROSI
MAIVLLPVETQAKDKPSENPQHNSLSCSYLPNRDQNKLKTDDHAQTWKPITRRPSVEYEIRELMNEIARGRT